METRELTRPQQKDAFDAQSFSSEEAKTRFRDKLSTKIGAAIALGVIGPAISAPIATGGESEQRSSSISVSAELFPLTQQTADQQRSMGTILARQAEEQKKEAQERQKREAQKKPGLTAGLSRTQMDNAEIIVETTEKRNMPDKAKTVALATALQESTLFNYANSKVPKSMNIPHEKVGKNGTSVGLFQQQVGPDGSGGGFKWGNVKQTMNPVKSTNAFLDGLEEVKGWEKMPVTVAAQQVQASAHPEKYADDEVTAKKIVSKINKA